MVRRSLLHRRYVRIMIHADSKSNIAFWSYLSYIKCLQKLDKIAIPFSWEKGSTLIQLTFSAWRNLLDHVHEMIKNESWTDAWADTYFVLDMILSRGQGSTDQNYPKPNRDRSILLASFIEPIYKTNSLLKWHRRSYLYKIKT